jgi:hypothetical protein
VVRVGAEAVFDDAAGCAVGGAPLRGVAHVPEGVELGAHQAQRGQALIAALGLTNVVLLHQDILSLDETLGRFDYILAHGVYSWVPA